MIRRALVLVLLLAASALADGPFTKATLPEGWSVTREVVVPASQLPGFSQRLGGTITGLRNQFLDANGLAVQANRIRGATEADAERIEAALLRLRPRPFVYRDGKDVVEVAGTNVLAAARIRGALGHPIHERRVWEVRFPVALVDTLVESTRNEVFNLFIARERRRTDPALETKLREKTKDWSFGKTLRLLDGDWSFEPGPEKAEPQGDGTTLYTFGEVPEVLGIPYVRVKGRIAVRPRFEPTPIDGDEGSTAGTATWPVKGVEPLAAAATKGATTPRSKVLALLRHLAGRIRYGGPQGSRDPVPEVLKRGYARCFDKSDVFVAFCRAQGIPARVVAGWVPALGAGHVWTEVRLGEAGWIPVDATTTWLGTGTDYIPFFRTQEGPLPFVYLAMPTVRAVE